MEEEKKYRITSGGKKLYDSQIKATRKYEHETYSKLTVRVRKEEYAEMKAKIEGAGYSVNNFALTAVREKLETL